MIPVKNWDQALMFEHTVKFDFGYTKKVPILRATELFHI